METKVTIASIIAVSARVVDWEPEDGDWRIVLMNADGSRGVASELSIGADTALNSIVEVTDKIKQSAVAARRCFVVETMGHKCGYLALMAGIAGGAEAITLPEVETDPELLQIMDPKVSKATALKQVAECRIAGDVSTEHDEVQQIPHHML